MSHSREIEVEPAVMSRLSLVGWGKTTFVARSFVHSTGSSEKHEREMSLRRELLHDGQVSEGDVSATTEETDVNT